MTRLHVRSSILYFAAISLLVLWAFWSTYFSRPFSQTDVYIHAHALSLTLWCLLVVVLVHDRAREAVPLIETRLAV